MKHILVSQNNTLKEVEITKEKPNGIFLPDFIYKGKKYFSSGFFIKKTAKNISILKSIPRNDLYYNLKIFYLKKDDIYDTKIIDNLSDFFENYKTSIILTKI